MKDFEGKVIFGTGGASGLGAKIVELLSAGRARIAIADYDVAGAQRLAEETKGAKADDGSSVCRPRLSGNAEDQTPPAMSSDR